MKKVFMILILAFAASALAARTDIAGGARMYDSNTGRWFVTDPMAEKYYSISPYAYCLNNPVNRIDPNGMWVENSGDESSDSDNFFAPFDCDDVMTDFAGGGGGGFGNGDGIDYPVFGGEEQKGTDADGLFGGTLAAAVCTARAPLTTAQINYIIIYNAWYYVRSHRLTSGEMSRIGGAMVHLGHQKFFESPETQRAITYLSLIAPVAKGVSVIGNIIRTGAKFLAKQMVKEGTNVVDDVVKQAKNWLGKDAKVITNKVGDNIFMSKDGLRKIRFDIKNPHGDFPHIHLEEFVNQKWRDAIFGIHRIYPKP